VEGDDEEFIEGYTPYEEANYFHAR